MCKVGNRDFVGIPGWMRNLNLTNRELLLYGVIYGASQDGDCTYRGSYNHLCGWCGCSTKEEIDTLLSSLVEKNLIFCRTYTEEGKTLLEFGAILDNIN
jgi:hypothetical protein